MSSYLTDGYHYETAAAAPVNERVNFIRRTYLHLCVAILAFVGIEAALIASGAGQEFLRTIVAQQVSWILILALFIGGSMLASHLARSQTSVGVQYLGLCLYVGLEVVFFLPILTYCSMIPKYADVPVQAGILTLVVFGGLTFFALLSKRDFSFMGYALRVLSLMALGLIVVAIFTHMTLGVWFCVAMIGLMCGFILYSTSNILYHYPTTAHVAAALELFASIATMFWYMIQLLMSLSRD
jgi:FtsH-binding integral membrane protein